MRQHFHLILASSSRYRQQALRQLQLPFICETPAIDETPLPNEPPKDLALRLSIAKANHIYNRYPKAIVIGSDQVIELNGQAIGKSHQREAAIAQLKACSGNTLTAYSGLALVSQAGCLADVIETRITFRHLTDVQIEHYVEREPAYDCAGSVKSEGLGIALFDKVESDDPSALVGLPLIRLHQFLTQWGVDVLITP